MMGAELPLASLIGTVLVLIPLPRYWRARNIPVLLTITWLALCNFSSGVNTIIWANNVIIRFHVWCDITTKFTIGASIGLSAALVCICRFLSQVASPGRKVEDTKAKRRRKIFELAMCVGLPILSMALHIIVQANRFYILEDFGCQPYIYFSIPAVLIIYTPPLVLSSVCMVYAAIALRWFVHRRRQFQAVLQYSQSGLTTRRYLRLIALSSVMTIFVIGMATTALVSNLESVGLQPWVSWDYVHADWMRVDQIARLLAPPDYWHNVLIIWYIFPVCSVVFFTFFGIGPETSAKCRERIRWAKTRTFHTKPKTDMVLPVFARTGTPKLVLTVTPPFIIELETATNLSETRKWDGPPASAHPTSRPTSPHSRQNGTAQPEIHSITQ